MAARMAGGSTVAKSNESKKRLGRGLDSLMGMARPAPLAQVAVEPNADTAAQPKPAGGEPPAGSKYSPPAVSRGGNAELQMVCYLNQHLQTEEQDS